MYKILKISIVVCMLVFIAGCKQSYLEFDQKGKLVPQTADDYQLLMNNNSFYNYSYPTGWSIPMLMGDEISVQSVYYNRMGSLIKRPFTWDAMIYNAADNTPDITTFLRNLYSLNVIINNVMDSEGSVTQKQNVLAQALATRAWINFQLVNFYCKPYDSSTASQDPGFPIITEADINGNSYSRGTVQQMYDFIIKDLTDAIAGLPLENGVRTLMSKPDARGILGKVYLFIGKPDEARTLLNQALADVETMTNGPRLYDYNKTFATGGSFLPIGTTGPPSPLLNTTDYTESLVFKTYGNFNGTQFGNAGIVLKPEIAALFEPSDFRLKFYSHKNPDGTIMPANLLRKYGVRYTRFGLELPELYLLIAEAEARLNDLTAAVATLETFRSKRMPVEDALVPAGIASSQKTLLKFIMDERLREYAAEGYRWFDMRRTSVDPLFSKEDYTHYIYETDGTFTTISLNQPSRLTLKIPPAILSANPDMQDNP